MRSCTKIVVGRDTIALGEGHTAPFEHMICEVDWEPEATAKREAVRVDVDEHHRTVIDWRLTELAGLVGTCHEEMSELESNLRCVANFQFAEVFVPSSPWLTQKVERSPSQMRMQARHPHLI